MLLLDNCIIRYDGARISLASWELSETTNTSYYAGNHLILLAIRYRTTVIRFTFLRLILKFGSTYVVVVLASRVVWRFFCLCNILNCTTLTVFVFENKYDIYMI